MTWFVLCVKARQERQVADTLRNLQIEVYCPLLKETRQWSDRTKMVETPLFRSYVFVRLAEKDRPLAFQVPGVVRYLFWLGKPAVVRDDEINTIKSWLDSDKLNAFELSGLAPGQEITIGKGLLKDRKAVIQKMGKTRMRLILRELGVVVTAKIKEIV